MVNLFIFLHHISYWIDTNLKQIKGKRRKREIPKNFIEYFTNDISWYKNILFKEKGMSHRHLYVYCV